MTEYTKYLGVGQMMWVTDYLICFVVVSLYSTVTDLFSQGVFSTVIKFLFIRPVILLSPYPYFGDLVFFVEYWSLGIVL